MLTFNELTAIAFRIFINFLAGNQKAINTRLTSILEKGFSEYEGEDAVRLGTLFSTGNFRVGVMIVGKTAYLEVDRQTGTFEHTVQCIKLGKTGFDPINKRVINELNVIFHREYRDQSSMALDSIRKAIRRASVNAFLGSFRLIDRLIGRQKLTTLKTDSDVDQIVEVSVRAVKAITGKTMVKVFVSTEINDKGWITEGLTPVHFGAIREFTVYGNTDSVDDLIFTAVEDHLRDHLA